MKTSALLVGIDFGTTYIKAVVFDTAGKIVSAASAPTPTHYPRPDWAQYDAEEIWQSTVQAVREAVARVDHRERIVGVAVASIGETGVLLDAGGDPTCEAIAWFDRRTRPQAQWLAEHIGEDRLFAVSGMSLQPIFSLCKLMWLRDHRPDAFQRSERWLFAADYIAYRLCGEMATDYSVASRTMMLDIHRLRWAADLVREAGIDPGLLAPLVPSGTRLGTVHAMAAEATGLPTSAVVAAGGHDHVCGALAVGVVRSGDVLNSIGTAEAMFMAVERPLTDPETGRQGYTQGAHTAGGYYLLGGNYTSGACIEWFRDSCPGGMDLATLTAEAEQVPAGSLGAFFLPHLRLANPPNSDDRARGAFVGLTTDVKRGALFRAILEGVCFESRNTLEPLLRYTGVDRPGNIYVTGGATRNRLLMHIKASILGQPIHVMKVEESTALGAAVLGGLAAGIYEDTTDVLMQLDRDETLVEPASADAEFYAQAYRTVYQTLFSTLRTVNHKIFDLQDVKNGG